MTFSFLIILGLGKAFDEALDETLDELLLLFFENCNLNIGFLYDSDRFLTKVPQIGPCSTTN